MSWRAGLSKVASIVIVLALACIVGLFPSPVALATGTTITQIAPTSGSTTVDGSNAFSDQLNVAGNDGTVNYTATGGADMSDFTVTSSGAISVNSQLSAGSYVVSGIDNDDPNGDSGTWTYTLVVGAITQIAPTSGSTTVDGSNAFSDQLNAAGNDGTVNYTATGGADMSDFTVTSSGAISVNSQLSAGSYVVSGIDNDDPSGDSGTWTYTLTVTAPPIRGRAVLVQTSVTTGSVSTASVGTFTSGPITVDGNLGSVTFVTTNTSPGLAVTSSGLVSTTGILQTGSYSVSGTDSDPNGDSGTWTYTLTVIAATVTVTFNTNGGTGSMTPEDADAPTALSLNQFVRKGYTFVNWNTTQNGSGVSYGNGAIFPFTTATSLFAQWKRGKVPAKTITFFANGGKGATASETENTPTAVKANLFTRRGYTFVAWNTSPKGAGESYKAGATYAFKKSITLYAQWKRRKVPVATAKVVTFVANGGRGAMSRESNRAPSPLNPNHFSRAGYTFVDWNTSAKGSGHSYTNGAMYPFSTSTTLYARWKEKVVAPTSTPPPIPKGPEIGPFAADSFALSSSLDSQIRALAVQTKSKRDLRISLLGYGDKLTAKNESNAALRSANITLSRERAQAVATYLEARLSALGLTGFSISIGAANTGGAGTGQAADDIVVATLG